MDSYCHFYESSEHSDIDIISNDGIKKSLHKIILSKNSLLFKSLVKDQSEITLNVKWKYLEPILIFIYNNSNNFDFCYSNLADDNINTTLSEFENILHCAIHLQLSPSSVDHIIRHFDYKKRLNKSTMKDLRKLLYSLKRISNCKYIGNNLNLVIISFCDTIIYKLMRNDDYLSSSFGSNLDSYLISEIYDNIKCVWRINDINSETIDNFINYNLNKLNEYEIDIGLLYLLVTDETPDNIEYNLNSLCDSSQTEINDTVSIFNLNNIIVECISSFVLDNPNPKYLNIYKMLCNNKNIHEKIIRKILVYCDKIDLLQKKVTCSICINNELNCCLKNCGHLFCMNCINGIVSQQNTNYIQCPICKKDFNYERDVVTIFI